VDECKTRKEEMQLEKYKKKVFLCHKWDILREKVSIFNKDSNNIEKRV
jgi:hypothetical protein